LRVSGPLVGGDVSWWMISTAIAWDVKRRRYFATGSTSFGPLSPCRMQAFRWQRQRPFRVLLGYGLDEWAMEVLKTNRFAPAYRSGRRVGVIAHIDVAFNLRDFRTPVYKVTDGDKIKIVSLPGGFFYVGTGLNLVEDEAELAPTITEYANRIGQGIATHSDAKISFTIIVSDPIGDSE
jgi:hypothetical protein